MENGSLVTPNRGTRLLKKQYPVRLTDAKVKALQTDDRDRIVFDALQPGFGVRLTPAGTKIFVARTRVNGQRRVVSVGTFPEKTVSEARTDARAALEDMRAGRDPKIEKVVRRKAIEAGSLTVSEFADRWMEEYVHKKLKPRTAQSYRSLLEQRIRPSFGHLPVSRVTKDDVLKFHAGLEKTPGRANRAVQTFRALMTYAEDTGLRPPLSNPCRKVKMYRERARERFLSEAEIAKAADAITSAEKAGKIGPHAATGLRLCLFTGARSGEITATKWEHVSFERKIIRIPDSKTNDPRTIHLSDAALEVLRGVPRVGPYVIAGAKPNEAYKNLSRAWIKARKPAGLEDVRLHDLRHSYASLAAGRGVSLQMIGKLLGHKVMATTMRYAHLARDAVGAVNDELGEAMTAAIEKAAKPKTGNVVKMKRGNVTKRK